MTTDHSITTQLSANPKRSLKNYILQPLLQIKLGLYSILLSIAFSLAVSAILYFNLGKFTAIVLELTGVEDEVKDLLIQYLAPAQIQLAAAMVLYILITIVMSIKYTHTLVGPTVAFRRHIRMLAEGKYDYQTRLRDGDAFSEVADDLNNLSKLYASKTGEKIKG